MAAPTFVDEHEVADWMTRASSKATGSFAVTAGDRLVVVAITGDNAANITGVSGGGLTWTEQIAVEGFAQFSAGYIYTATATSTTSITVTVTASGGTVVEWGFNVLRFSGSDGFGAVAGTHVSSGTPSLGLTTTGANSAIVWINSDWSAKDGASRVYRTTGVGAFTEQTYDRDPSFYAVYAGFHADVGASGAKTVGLTSPTAQKYTIVGIEVLGSAAQLSAIANASTSSEVAQAVRRVKTKLIQPAIEADNSQALIRRKTRSVLASTETDVSASIARRKSRQLSAAIESDSSQTVARRKTRTVLSTIESDVSQIGARLKSRLISSGLETDLAQSVERSKSRIVVAALESDLAKPISLIGQIIVAVQPAFEVNISSVVVRRKSQLITPASEVNTAEIVSPVGFIVAVVQPAIETDLASSVNRQKTLVVGTAIEQNLAKSLAEIDLPIIAPTITTISVGLSRATIAVILNDSSVSLNHRTIISARETETEIELE